MSLKKLLSVFLVLSGIAFVVFFVWSQQVLRADTAAIDKVRSGGTVTISETDHAYVLKPAGYRSGTGLVFVPGGKIAPNAYIYKLSGLVESLGMTVVITKPYFNLAVLDFRPFTSFTYDVGGIERWYVGGHSVGGVRACSYATDQRNEIKGVVLFASYCQDDITAPALALRGDQDGLVSEQDIRQNSAHLTGDNNYYEIEGANHASFGDYGTQKGDGTAELPSEDMREELISYIASWHALEN